MHFHGSKTLEEAQLRAGHIATKMFGDTDLPVVGGVGVLLRKVWRRIYDSIKIDTTHLEKIRTIAKNNGPVIFIPTHRSYMDFLIVSFICFVCRLPMPYIAAGEDFLGILFVRWLFRKSGAFFLRRSFLGNDDELYSAIFKEYVSQLLCDGQSLEFFIEGTRSRSGKLLHPKMGLLSIITDAALEGSL